MSDQAYANWKIEIQRLARFRICGIKHTLISGLQAVSHTDNGPVDDDSHRNVGLIQGGIARSYRPSVPRSADGQAMALAVLPHG